MLKNTDMIGYADIIQIIFDNKCIKIYDDLNYSFDELLSKAKENGYKKGTIVVIAESPFDGVIYRYGNYGLQWLKIGSTIGYA